MLKRILKLFLPNPLDKAIKLMKKKKQKKLLLTWNRGLGDIPLGLYAMVQRIHQIEPEIKIHFLIRPDLKEGFSMLDGVERIYVSEEWQRFKPYDLEKTLKNLKIENQFDVILDKIDPYKVVTWQYGKVNPALKWDSKNDALYKKFNLDPNGFYVGIQPITETNYNFFRNWSYSRYEELFSLAQEKMPKMKFILFGFKKDPLFHHSNLIDLRGETSLLEMLSIIKNRCQKMVLGDSGILAMTYYLKDEFPMHLITLWANPDQGILRQNVPSPNSQLIHSALYADNRDLSTIRADEVMSLLQQGKSDEQ
jgi:ADP-heptose:LPS heptosyltransferase